MKKIAVSALVPEKKDAQGKVTSPQLGPVTVEVPFAETLKEAAEMYGEEAVLTNAFANWRVTLQANIRGGLKRGEGAEAITGRLANAKMGVAVTGSKMDAEAAFKAKFLAATPEGRKAMIEQLRKLAQG
jgi:2-succinyl-5-enolpyruvyl-6-hydroxy-3-cyclohexene-1-carboxylate synthase